MIFRIKPEALYFFFSWLLLLVAASFLGLGCDVEELILGRG